MNLFCFKKRVITFFFIFSLFNALAQPGTSIDLEAKKPEKYKEKLLKSEKTPDKKIGMFKRFSQNMVTHYNYYYNATVKLDDIYEKAKESFVDDYTKLLPFYNYNLSTTAQDANIDSIIYKCNAGILLHDLRSDWVDDMYMLLGKAYLLRKNFDSAYIVFQYLNYVYAPKQDGYDIPIGSNESNEQGLFTIATDEKTKNFLKKVFTKPLKRNDALVWLVRNYLEQKRTGEASAILEILQHDPQFPKRLNTDLYEMLSYNYYQQKTWDSSATYLLKCLDNAATRAERGRWEFLAAQMLQLAGMQEKAEPLYKKAIKHSTNPEIEIYAHLNMLLGFSNEPIKSKNNDERIAALLKLAKRERYENYRDIIYYTLGKISLDDKNIAAAETYFTKSTKYSVDNPKQKSKSYLALADVEYMLKHYKQSNSYYDSVDVKLIDSNDAKRVAAVKPSLKKLTENLDAIYLQDSLQALAKLQPKELNAVLKKIYKNYLKEKGLKEDANSFDFGSDNSSLVNTSNAALFDDAKPGDFYFASTSLKNQGTKDFKNKWGNRPNVDNWNRAAAVSGKIDAQNADNKSNAPKTNKPNNKAQNIAKSVKQQPKQDDGLIPFGDQNDDPNAGSLQDNSMQEQATEETNETDITPETLFAAIPLDKEKQHKSDSTIIEALFGNGDIFSNQLEDYPSAVDTYEELLRRFPNNKHTEQVLFNLSYCYQRTGKQSKADAIKEKLELGFANGTLANALKNKTLLSDKDAATLKYTGIYNKFIEGKYDEAEQEKAEADSVYKQKYWNSQLNFIEAVYYIKQRKDDTAIDRLTLIANGAADKALKEKAELMIDILKRRKEIEDHLAKLDSNGKYDSNAVAANAVKDSVAKNKLVEDYEKDMSLLGKPFTHNPNEPHYGVMLLEDVDDVFLAETKKSFTKYNYENYTGNPPVVRLAKLNKKYTLVLLGPLVNAANGIAYIDRTKPLTPKFLPWLPAFKYSYTMIGVSNLDILRVNDNLAEYKKFLKSIFPSKF